MTLLQPPQSASPLTWQIDSGMQSPGTGELGVMICTRRPLVSIRPHLVKMNWRLLRMARSASAVALTSYAPYRLCTLYSRVPS